MWMAMLAHCQRALTWGTVYGVYCRIPLSYFHWPGNVGDTSVSAPYDAIQ